MYAISPTQDTAPIPVLFPELSADGWTELVGRLEAQHPTELARLHRGLAILRAYSRHPILEDSASYLVPSSVPGQYYRTNTARCTCPDYLQRQRRCKHVWAVTVLVAGTVTARFEQLARETQPIAYELTDKALAALDGPTVA
jgi:uncharacterized Zn finger protein